MNRWLTIGERLQRYQTITLAAKLIRRFFLALLFVFLFDENLRHTIPSWTKAKCFACSLAAMMVGVALLVVWTGFKRVVRGKAKGTQFMAAMAASESADAGDRFAVILTNARFRKINVIKIVYEETGIGLKNAKDLVERAPETVADRLSWQQAATLKLKLESEGAAVKLISS